MFHGVFAASVRSILLAGQVVRWSWRAPGEVQFNITTKARALVLHTVQTMCEDFVDTGKTPAGFLYDFRTVGACHLRCFRWSSIPDCLSRTTRRASHSTAMDS